MNRRGSNDEKIDRILAELGMAHDEKARQALHSIAANPAPAPSTEQSQALARAVRASGSAGSAEASVETRAAIGFAAVVRGQFATFGRAGLVLGLTIFAAAFGLIYLAGGGLLAASATAPLCAGLFLAYAFRASYYGVSEIENTCPVGPAQLALARLAIAGAADAAAALVAAGLVSSVTGEPFSHLLISCLGPMALLLGLALWASLAWGAAAAIALVSAVSGAGLLPWGLSTGISPLAPVGSPGFFMWKTVYAVCGLALICSALLRQKRLQEGGLSGAPDA